MSPENVDDYLQRFRNKNKNEVKQRTLDAYAAGSSSPLKCTTAALQATQTGNPGNGHPGGNQLKAPVPKLQRRIEKSSLQGRPLRRRWNPRSPTPSPSGRTYWLS